MLRDFESICGYDFVLRLEGKQEVVLWTFRRKAAGRYQTKENLWKYALPQKPWRHSKPSVLIAGLELAGYTVEKVIE